MILWTRKKTICIFSGDADFVYLNNFLRKKGKKVIIFKGGYITTKLRKTADLVINAKQIKKDIVRIKKQRPDIIRTLWKVFPNQLGQVYKIYHISFKKSQVIHKP